MVIEVHEFLGNFWWTRVSSVRDHESSQEFTIGTCLAVARTILIQRMSLENSFAVRFTRSFHGGACLEPGTPRHPIAVPPGLDSRLEGQEGSTSSRRAPRAKQSTSRR